MRRDTHQRRAYALRRMSKAVDRVICGRTESDKARASRWAVAWARVAGVNPPTTA
ncbi:hypothetical protein [Burkholderia vietnamiensis]|uniref:hypothetical protein n=1 Tax=Burkholderia vietnamiensis TaxID=60552 RepID=UPI001592E505|nr:hypothetical protein [Burkholderia vietnamiensis]